MELMTSGTLVNLIKKEVLDWRDGSDGKALATKPNNVNWIPGTHVVGENQLQPVLRKSRSGTHMCDHIRNNFFAETGRVLLHTYNFVQP